MRPCSELTPGKWTTSEGGHCIIAIDRFGQQHDPVVRYLYLRGTFEEHILLRLIAKYERQRQDEWLQQRACEITAGQQELPQQIDLFNAAAPGAQARAARPWSTLTDPAEQLVAFAADTSQPPRLRSEADGVLRIDRQRASALQAQPDLDQPEVRLIGALMIVPSL